MKWTDLLFVVPILMAVVAFWWGMRLNRQQKNEAQRALAAEDMILYGTGFLKITPDGKEERIDPRDIYFDMDGKPTQSNTGVEHG
jgi:hypothetical protein